MPSQHALPLGIILSTNATQMLPLKMQPMYTTSPLTQNKSTEPGFSLVELGPPFSGRHGLSANLSHGITATLGKQPVDLQ